MKNQEPILKYLVREPRIGGDKPPVIILLHGVGSNEHDLFTFSNMLPDKFLVISARAPYTLGAGSYSWFHVDFSTGQPVIDAEQAELSRGVIIQFIGQLSEKHFFDEKQIYLCGFSQGGIMSYSIGLTHPELVAGVAVMSGRILDEVKPQIVSADKLQNLQVFISHGINDPVLSIRYAREGFAFLQGLNLHPVYKEYNEAHTISFEMLQDLVEWLKLR